MEKIEFEENIDEGDVLRKSLTVLYKIVYADRIVFYFSGGTQKELPLNGLSDKDIESHNNWDSMVSENIKSEYKDGNISQAAFEKLQAEN